MRTRIRREVGDDWREVARAGEPLDRVLERHAQTVDYLAGAVDEERNEENLSHLGRALARHTVMLRLAGACEAALTAARRARDVWRELDRDRPEFLAELQEATCLDRIGEHDLADALFSELYGRTAGDLKMYRDFVLEPWALAAARRGAWAAALQRMDECLELRKERGTQKQIDATARLIERLRSALAEEQESALDAADDAGS